MTDPSPIAALRHDTVLPEGAAPAARLLEPLLTEVAGAGAEPVSITLDYGPVAKAGDSVVVEALVERATRTLVFAVGRLLTREGTVLVTGSAVFRRGAAA